MLSLLHLVPTRCTVVTISSTSFRIYVIVSVVVRLMLIMLVFVVVIYWAGTAHFFAVAYDDVCSCRKFREQQLSIGISDLI